MNVKKSKNYEWFKYLGNNRKISQRHLSNLREQFALYGNITEVSPIAVNKNGFILDGQHRFTLCKELGLEVYYIEKDFEKELTPAMNANQRAWKSLDYINFYAAYKPEYKLLLKFVKDNNTTYPIAATVLYTQFDIKNAAEKMLRDGDIKVSPFIEKAQENMDFVNEVQEVVRNSISERYVRGLMAAIKIEEFDIERFLKKLRLVMRNSPDIPNLKLSAIADVRRNIEQIYNYRAREESVSILFR